MQIWARPLTSNVERTIDQGTRKQAEVQDNEHEWGGKTNLCGGGAGVGAGEGNINLT